MKKIPIFLCCLVIIWLFFFNISTYNLKQDESQIICIELLKNTNISSTEREFEVIYTVDDSERELFIDRLCNIRCYKYWNDPAANYGKYIIRIFYLDGAIELIGSNNNGYIVDQQESTGIYYFNDNAFVDLFLQYIPIMEHDQIACE